MKNALLTAALSALAVAAMLSSFSLSAHALQTLAHGKLDELIKKGDDLYKANKLKDAIDAYKKALALDPNNDQAIGYIAYSREYLFPREINL